MVLLATAAGRHLAITRQHDLGSCQGGRADGQSEQYSDDNSPEIEAFSEHLASPFYRLGSETRGPPNTTLVASGSGDVRLLVNLLKWPLVTIVYRVFILRA